MSEYARTNRVAKPSLTPVNGYSGRTSSLPFSSPSFLAHLPAVSSSCLLSVIERRRLERRPHEAGTCHAEIWLPRAAAQYHCPVDMVYGSFIVSIDQHFRQRISHPRGADTSAAAFHLARSLSGLRNNVPPSQISALLSISAVREERPSPPTSPVCLTFPLLPPPLASGGALSSSCGASCVSGCIIIYYGYCTCAQGNRRPDTAHNPRNMILPTIAQLFIDITSVVVARAITLGPHLPSLPTSLLPSTGSTGDARARSTVPLPRRRRFIVDGRAPRTAGDVRDVLVLICDVHPYHAHLGQALFMEHAWRVHKKVLPYRSPRETLSAQASIASGPARASASTTTMCRRYSPAILQSSDLPSAVMGIRST
ncbi:hypothetical protein B0H13DRAFT_2314260 [Mycena leptocephala]|nr:hypothetical protein B0H13DRAFT_2314260 [Mycena leptocephala]